MGRCSRSVQGHEHSQMRRRRPLGARAGVLIASAALAFQAAPTLARPNAPLNWPVVRSSAGWTVSLGPACHTADSQW